MRVDVRVVEAPLVQAIVRIDPPVAEQVVPHTAARATIAAHSVPVVLRAVQAALAAVHAVAAAVVRLAAAEAALAQVAAVDSADTGNFEL